MLRTFRRFSLLAVLLGAWAFVGKDRIPVPLGIAEAEARQEAAETQGGQKTHDLSALRVFTKTILYVRDNYVDPKRVKPKEMMISALEYVEKAVPDVVVDGNADQGKLTVVVNGKSKAFDISDVDSIWRMNFKLKDVFEHVSKNMRPIDDTRDIEYAAVNGMLSTLDPHSVLLRPEMYREMKLSTKGEFGGLGFVIQMKEGNLTVVKVLPKTPAYRAGIKKDDHIRKIGEESTVNMDLNEAVSKLRGPVDSKVTITIDRKGWDKPQAMTLTRAIITIESVQSKLLSQNVGYVRLKNFQSNTTRDLQSALQELSKQSEAQGSKMKGLVLDMRGNPGGLLDQAIQVSDLFVPEGTIVSTVGYSDKMREEKKAHQDPSDTQFPIAVLVNAGSASASEIVAGALKNLDRAVIIGKQTFGKGSVQVLYEFPDDSALKLTIAKYLTPGDVSIQEVGITPDISLIPTRVTKERVDVFAPRKSMGEADLDHHFGNPDSAEVAKKRDDVLGREKPTYELKYLKEDAKQKDASAKQQLQEEGKAPKVSKKDKGEKAKHGEKDPLLDVDVGGNPEELDDQLDAESQDEVKEDFEVLFARDFVLRVPALRRGEAIKAGKSFVDETAKEEANRINNAISALGLDWKAGPTPKTVDLEAKLTPNVEQKLAPGETVNLELSVTNKGTEPLSRLRAWTESDNGYLDRREFLFGALAPGEKKTWSVPIKLPKDLAARRDDVTVKFVDDSGLLPETVVSELTFGELPRPAFAFAWQVIDTCQACNGDGVVQRGESVTVLLDVKNTGAGKALDAFAQVKNAADQNIFIEKGRFKLGELDVGATKTARFELEVKPGYKGDDFPLKLAIVDEPLEEVSTDKISIPVSKTGATLEAKKGLFKAPEGTLVYDSAAPTGRAFAKLKTPLTLASDGKSQDFVRVELDKDRQGFVKVSEVKEAKGGKPQVAKDLEYLPLRVPPQITINAEAPTGAYVAEGEKFSLSGSVQSPRALLDVYVLVNDQKVFFEGSKPDADPTRINFKADFALKEGNNYVQVVARESSDFASRKTIVVRRRPASIAQKLQQH